MKSIIYSTTNIGYKHCGLSEMENKHLVLYHTPESLNEMEIDKLRLNCPKTIPAEYIPKFEFILNMEEYFLDGMVQMKLNRKGELY